MANVKTTGREPTVGIWAGNEQFTCPFCPFDSLEEARVREHIDQVHPIPAPPERPPKKVKEPADG